MQILKIPPGPQFLDHSMAQLTSRIRNAQTVILVPTAAHIMPVKQALHRQGGFFLLPRVITLDYWLNDLPPLADITAISELQRLLFAHQALKNQQWLRQALGAQTDQALFNLAQTLVTLCDELSGIWLPRFAQQTDGETMLPFAEILEPALEKAYAHIHQRVLGEETQLLLAFWRALCEPNSPIILRWQSLQRLAQHITGPVIWLSPAPPSDLEMAFLIAADKQAEVIQIHYDWFPTAVISNKADCVNSSPFEILHQAWPELNTATANTSPQYSNKCVSTSNALPTLQLTLCPNFESQAIHAAHLLIDWLNQGLTNLALVTQDRLIARRIQALLARAGIQVHDETGWKFSTTRAAATIMQWFDLLRPTPDSQALLDWLKSPFVFAHHARLKEEVTLLEYVMRRHTVDSDWYTLSHALTRIEVDDPHLLHSTQILLTELQQTIATWLTGKKSLAQWCGLLEKMLDDLGIRPLLEKDGTGTKLLNLLDDLIVSALQIDNQKFSLTEFRALLDLHLEKSTSTSTPDHTGYRITFLPLNGLRMRYFDAVLMAGCDESRLPAPLQETLFLSSTLRTQLGLLDRIRSQQQQLCDLAELFLNQPIVCFSWQAQGKQGEPQSLAPWLLRLEQYLQQVFPEKIARQIYQAPVYQTDTHSCSLPRPVAITPLPKTISANSYNALRRCPYQFFSRHLLGLQPLAALEDSLEKRDLGIWLHELLFRYHNQFNTSLMALSEAFFKQKIAQDGRAIAYWQQWRTLIPNYLVWHQQRLAQGWQWYQGEQELQRTVSDPDLCLVGRIDRLEQHAEEGYAVLDYKVQNKRFLSAKLKKIDDDVQLPFYALLQADIAQAGWITLAGDTVTIISLPEPGKLAETLLAQIKKDFQALSQGTPLPAYGKIGACRLCEARGLCRKGYWQDR